jgi:hypothetical protein
VQGWFLRLCDKLYVTIIAKYHQHEKPLSKEPGILFRKVFKAIYWPTVRTSSSGRSEKVGLFRNGDIKYACNFHIPSM